MCISVVVLCYLERLDEGPEQGADPLSSAKKLHQTHDSKEPEECDGDSGVLLTLLEHTVDRGYSEHHNSQ